MIKWYSFLYVVNYFFEKAKLEKKGVRFMKHRSVSAREMFLNKNCSIDHPRLA